MPIKCPLCKQPMIIARINQGRVYQCPDYQCTYDHGEVMDSELILSVQAISEDMLLKRQVDASQAAVRQMFYRRLAGQLEAFPEAQQYLSQPEIETLKQCADILERLASAAELAKQVDYESDRENQQLLQLRYKKIFAELASVDLFDAVNPVDLAVQLLTLSELRGDVLPALDLDQLNQMLIPDDVTDPLSSQLTRQLTLMLHEQRQGLAHKLAEQAESVEDVMQQTLDRYQQICPQVRKTHYLTLDAIQNMLSIEQMQGE
jgi:hypothetical protein